MENPISVAQKTLQYQQVKKDAEINSSPPTRNKMNGVTH